ncbi:MAG TPA: hypothetical protein VLA03_03140 [Draconibacterium sp.]|nr:hypothetical protein [Draconibacterium sp.]
MKQIFFLLCILFLVKAASSQEVKINTNLAIETDGTVRMDGAATVWDDLRIPLSEPSTGKVLPEWSGFPYGNNGSVPYINWFRASGIDEMYFVVQLPHDWNEGSDIFPHIHWVPSADGSGVPRWGLQYAWANIGELFPGYSTIYGSVRIPGQTGNLVKSTQYLTPLGTGIVGAGKNISSMLVCRIFRDGDHADDTFPGLAGALEVDFHYERNTLGSRSEYTK